MPLAEELFSALRSRTVQRRGVSRESYGPGEQVAHELAAQFGRDHGLELSCDAAGNLYLRLPGRDRSLPAWITGSHLDSVPEGGNFDGAAGVIAGLAVAAGFRRAGIVPERDVVVMAVRAEEASSWFAGSHQGHIGSRAALGLLNPAELDEAVHSGDSRNLGSHMREAGFDPAHIFRAAPYLRPERFHGYLELHIEQGPVLETIARPVGIVTGIRGSARARSARCIGAYSHSGAVPREYRSDAVLATVALCGRLDEAWTELQAAGADLVFTVGKLTTDPALHGITKVPGETRFSIDLRSQDCETLATMTERVRAAAEMIGRERRVRFELGAFDLSPPASMDAGLQDALAQGAQALGIAAPSLPSGAGHDAQDFAHAGFRSGMIFVRNANGSHNPDEAMAMKDFCLGTQLLAWLLAR
ncbi:MAG: hydantoinase/carbamoylase family amidase [Betaproteobacteria bacterium]|nr:hydantoinase/carbamoylase family amidase [Betaproteobacteria bacterium]